MWETGRQRRTWFPRFSRGPCEACPVSRSGSCRPRSPSRSARKGADRPARRSRRSVWSRLVWGLAAAVVLAAGAAPVGVGGKYGKATVRSWIMSTSLPANPKLSMVYRPVLTQYTEAEAKAACRGFLNPARPAAHLATIRAPMCRPSGGHRTSFRPTLRNTSPGTLKRRRDK